MTHSRSDRRVRETWELLSCDPVALYGKGEIADPDFDLDRLVSIAGRFDGASEVGGAPPRR